MPKCGFITGSRFKDMLTEGRGKAKWGVTSNKLAMRVAAERIGVLELDLNGYVSDSMQHGIDEEETAIEAYERKTFTEVHGKQEFQQHPKWEFVGCTPDGLILDDGLLEVKNPDSENHLFHILNGKQLDQYEAQIQGSLWVTGRAYCDFISHDSRIQSEKLRIDITRVERDEEFIEKIESRYMEFEQRVEEYIEKINEIIETNKSLIHV